jgi:hypothetical protein
MEPMLDHSLYDRFRQVRLQGGHGCYELRWICASVFGCEIVNDVLHTQSINTINRIFSLRKILCVIAYRPSHAVFDDSAERRL